MVHLCRKKTSKALQYRGDEHNSVLKQLVMKAKQIQMRDKQKFINPGVSWIFGTSYGRNEGRDFPSFNVFKSKLGVFVIEGLGKSSSWQSPHEHLNCLWVPTACFHTESSPEIQNQNRSFSALVKLCQCPWPLPLPPTKFAQAYNTFRSSLLLVLQHEDWIYLGCRRILFIPPDNWLTHEWNPCQSSRLVIPHQEEQIQVKLAPYSYQRTPLSSANLHSYHQYLLDNHLNTCGWAEPTYLTFTCTSPTTHKAGLRQRVNSAYAILGNSMC